ncbi:hypothetical protein [Nannocystis bainbridge]|uniref:Uncharacterized protein n=1 Tax=Nannocystis bainbridge TaxID=2995303 RepID=A0ABT5DSM2_9BACT|nr:hypothetical protein [Nannocystis bainbridge]MDC0716180.1 hypothetical protein [Nannocystis bainbridge]
MPLVAVLVAAAMFAYALASCGNEESLRPQVLVYYANETAPAGEEAESWDTIISWLASSDRENVSKIADQLHRDREKFPKAVDEELAAMARGLPATAQVAGAALFTNRLARRGKFLLFRADTSVLVEAAFAPAGPDEEIYMYSPLADAASLDRALREVGRRAGDFVPAASHRSSQASRPRVWD